MVADGEASSSGSAFEHAVVAYDAALDVLGDWGGDSDWLTRLPTPPVSPNVAALTQTEAHTRTHYRRKRDARDVKRTALTDEIARLSQQLADEQKRFPTQPRPLTGDALELSREYASMAARQRHQRQAAETQHTALQDLYDHQLKLAHQIQRLFTKALRIGRSLGPTRETVTIASYCGPTLGVSAHIAYLDSLLGQAHCVTGSGLFAQQRGQEFRHVRSRTVTDEGVQVEFVAAFVLPFRVDRVADAIWTETTCMTHEGRRVAYEHALQNARVQVSSFVSAPDAQDIAGSNHGQVVAGVTHGQTALRRFDVSATDGSVWLLAMNHARIVDADNKPTGSMKGDGWIHVEPVGSGNVSRVKWYHRVSGRPHGYETWSRDERARWTYAAVTAPMRTQWERHLARTIQGVENTLVVNRIPQRS